MAVITSDQGLTSSVRCLNWGRGRVHHLQRVLVLCLILGEKTHLEPEATSLIRMVEKHILGKDKYSPLYLVQQMRDKLGKVSKYFLASYHSMQVKSLLILDHHKLEFLLNSVY